MWYYKSKRVDFHSFSAHSKILAKVQILTKNKLHPNVSNNQLYLPELILLL